MGKAGRKRKQGRRTASGALARTPVRDQGCEGVQRRRAFYAVPLAHNDRGELVRKFDDGQTFDAIGRAWSAGLLGYRADELRDGARKIAALYWRHYGFHTPDSLARFQPSHGVGVSDPERDRIREQALNDTLDTVGKMGGKYRQAFDGLVIDMNPDSGPVWLDRIIAAQRAGHGPSEADGYRLDLAVKALRKVA